MLCLSVGGVMSGSTLLAGAGLLVVGVVLGFGGGLRDRRRPRSLTLAVHGFTVVGLAWALSILGRARIDAVLLIVMLGIVNRFVLRQGSRDDYILVAASTVLITISTTITPGLLFLPLIILYIPSALWALVTANALGQERHAPASRMDAQPLPQLQTAVVFGSLGLTLVAFLGVSLFPRYNFGRALAAGAFMSFGGAGSSMTLQTGGVSSRSTGEVIIRIDGSRTDVGLEGLYARVFSLDAFDGVTWSRSDRGREVPLDPGLQMDPPPWVPVRVRRLVPRGRPHPVVALGRRRPWATDLPRAVVDETGTWLMNVAQAALQIHYAVTPRSRPAPRSGGDPERFLDLPDGLDPRIPALAARLTRDVDTPVARMRAVLGYFDQFTYSLDPVQGTDADPLARFLFEGRAGHCELYAGAVAVLLRSSGVPARVATGYYGGWWNARSRELEFTTEDAHAWVEAWDGEQWRWIDATPPSNRTRRRGKPLAWLRDWYDWLDGLWYTQVVDYDERRRQRLLRGLGGQAADTWQWLSSRSSAGGSGPPPGVVVGGLVLIAVGIAGGAWRRRSGAWGERLRTLLAVEPHETLGRGVARMPEDLQPVARSAVTAYEAWRFGTQGSPEAVRAELRALQRALRQRRRPGLVEAATNQ
jgi:transglutaminase-like putative cysteine protease